MSEFDCFMCKTKVENMIMVAHVPQCYRAYCQKYNTEPYCTCNECVGRKTHAISGFILKSSSPPATSKSEPRPNVANINSVLPSNGSNPKVADNEPKAQSPKANMTILTANCCMVCEKKASPSAVPVPYINIGKHCQVMICTKKHLGEEGDHAAILNIIDHELDRITQHGDSVKSILGASDGEDEEYVNNPARNLTLLELKMLKLSPVMVSLTSTIPNVPKMPVRTCGSKMMGGNTTSARAVTC